MLSWLFTSGVMIVGSERVVCTEPLGGTVYTWDSISTCDWRGPERNQVLPVSFHLCLVPGTCIMCYWLAVFTPCIVWDLSSFQWWYLTMVVPKANWTNHELKVRESARFNFSFIITFLWQQHACWRFTTCQFVFSYFNNNNNNTLYLYTKNPNQCCMETELEQVKLKQRCRINKYVIIYVVVNY